MESSEKILNNSDVLKAIFRHLDFEEHLKLIKICSQFEYAILHEVWRSECKNLYIMQALPDTFSLEYNSANDVKTECSLTSEELNIILHHSSMYIHKLTLSNIDCLENIIAFNYHHLTELALYHTVVEDTHLQQVAKNCLNLQTLTLLYFRSSKEESNIRVNVFGEMKALNKLEINDIRFTSWNYFDVQQLLWLGHLKTLSIYIDISDNNDNKGTDNNSTDHRIYNIENLKIGTLPRSQYMIVCFIEDLMRFENLTKLSITLESVLTIILYDNFLTQLNNACPKLCELSFNYCFLKFKEFPLMNNLKHLTFERCFNIGPQHFDEIFRKLKLKSLSILGTGVGDEEEDISDYNYISNTLEFLNIQAMADIVTTFFKRQHKFENVSKVRLITSCIQSTGLCFSHNFPNLQELITYSNHISFEDILQLKHLKVLEFQLFDNMSWSYLEMLFQHPSLTHIIIAPSNCQDVGEHFERLPKCCEGLTTKLEYLNLPSVVYERALDFWPSFRQRNKLLKLEVIDCDTSGNDDYY